MGAPPEAGEGGTNPGDGCNAERRGDAELNATGGAEAEWDGKPGERGAWAERMILTRRRGGTEKDAEKQRRSQERRGRRQRRSGGYAARRARQGKFGENAMTKNQRIAGRFPEREGSRTYGPRPNVFSGAMDGLSPPPVRAPPMALAVQVLPDRADLISETMPQLPNRSLTVVWKPMVVCPQPDFYRRMQTVLTELALEQPCTLAEYPRGGTIAALAERNACNICFIDVATDSERAQLLISEQARAGAGARGAGGGSYSRITRSASWQAKTSSIALTTMLRNGLRQGT